MTTSTLPAASELTRGAPAYRPDVDILEQGDELLLRADVPGARADAIDVRYENGTLTLHARVEPRQDEATTWLLREYGTGDWHRSFELAETIDATGIRAEYADGVLTLHLPRVESARPRRIPVNTP
jgi:HSP20 family protein